MIFWLVLDFIIIVIGISAFGLIVAALIKYLTHK